MNAPKYKGVQYSITMDTKKFIKNNDLKFVRNKNTGEFGRIMNGKLRTVKTKDRGALLLLDNSHRKNGITITNKEWEQLPQKPF